MSKDDKIMSGSWYDIYNKFKDLSMTVFSWNNLPDTVNQRFMELSLFDYGKSVFFKDELIGCLALKAISAGQLDQCYEPTKINAYGGNGYQTTRQNNQDCIIIYNNFLRDIPCARLRAYAQRIYKIEKTIDINIHQQRYPFLLKTSKKQEFTVKNIYKQYDDFEPAIFVDEDMDMSKLFAVQTPTPFVADKLEDEKRKLMCEALSFIGIENNFSEKNEKMTKSEIMVSNGLAIACRNSKLQARQKAVEKINKMFGLNIEVDINNVSLLEFDDLQSTNNGGDIIE